jgi:hypothetical protein
MPLVSRTRATLRRAEFGFLGVVVKTRRHTPRFWGHSCNAGAVCLFETGFLPFLISWLMVGMKKGPFSRELAGTKPAIE